MRSFVTSYLPVNDRYKQDVYTNDKEQQLLAVATYLCRSATRACLRSSTARRASKEITFA